MSARMRSIDEVIEFLDTLPSLVRFQRRLGRQSIRGAAAEIGISPSGLNQIEHGHNYNVGSLKLILEWLNGESRSAEQRGDNGVPNDPTLFAGADTGADHLVDGGEPGGVGLSQSDSDRESSGGDS